MKTAFVFPGQGSQFVGMGKEFYDNFSIAKQVFLEVDDILEENLSKIIFEGPAEELTLTKHTQPALMATSIAMLKVIKQETGKEIEQLTNYVAGHSLGEFTALCAADSISLADTAKLLKIRGSAMQEAVPEGKGAMAAILGMSLEEVSNLCVKAEKKGLCQIANDNCPGQIVISGDVAAIDLAVELAKEIGKKAIKLNVSAPFHCDLIAPVKDIIENALSIIQVKQPKVPLIANVTALAVNDPEEIKINLVKQVTSRVNWNESINYLLANGVENIIEIGAGKVLSGLTKRIDKSIKSSNISSIKEMEEIFLTANS